MFREQHSGFPCVFCALSVYLRAYANIDYYYLCEEGVCVKRHKLLGKHENCTMINNVRNSYYPRDISFPPRCCYCTSVLYEWIWFIIRSIESSYIYRSHAFRMCTHRSDRYLLIIMVAFTCTYWYDSVLYVRVERRYRFQITVVAY